MAISVAVVSSCTDDLERKGDNCDITLQADFGDTGAWQSGGGSRSGNQPTEPTILDFGVQEMKCSDGERIYLQHMTTPWTNEGAECSQQSRAATGAQTEVHEEILVSAYQYDGEWQPGHMQRNRANYFSNAKALRNGDGSYSFYPRQFYPNNGGKMRFVAFAPAGDAEGLTVNSGPEKWVPEPEIYYSVPTDGDRQTDLMMAVTEGFEIKGAQTLTPRLHFKHCLTAVSFMVDPSMKDYTIDRITISNIRTDALYVPRSFDATEVSKTDETTNIGALWQDYHHYNYANPKTFTKTYGEGYKCLGEGNEYVLGVDNSPISFMMIPQDVTPSSEITIFLRRPDGTATTFRANMSAHTWKPGNRVCYRISPNSWWQEVGVTPLRKICYHGRTETFRMSSWTIKEQPDGSFARVAAPWRFAYKPEGATDFSETAPAWLNFSATSGEGSVDPIPMSVTVPAAPVKRSVDLDAKLRTSYGSENSASPYNLAADGGSGIKNTANCYIVDRSGWFSLPAVYGNAIKDGIDNVKSYAPGGSDAERLPRFINHLEQEITSPYIATNANTKAGIVWTDAQGMVDQVEFDKNLYGGKGGIRFHIASDKIQQGNTVLKLYDNSDSANPKVMWSWHIWTTPILNEMNETVKVKNNAGLYFDFLSVNVGWVSLEPLIEYASRKCTVRIISTVDGVDRTADFEVEQIGRIRYWHGYSTFYQWGRKDPFPGGRAQWNSINWWLGDSETWRGNTYPYGMIMQPGKPGLAQRILNPDKWHGIAERTIEEVTASEGKVGMFFNLWDAANTHVFEGTGESTSTDPPIDHGTVKTIYDPSPVGFKVPTLTAFTGFSKDGKNRQIYHDANKNWDGDFDVYEYTFDTKRGDGSTVANLHTMLHYTDETELYTVAVPMVGYRDWAFDGTFGGAIYEVGNDAYYWTAMPRCEDRAYYACFRLGWADASKFDHIYPMNFFLQLDGMSVRPVTEADNWMGATPATVRHRKR